MRQTKSASSDVSKVLLVDDSAAARALLRTMLSALPVSVQDAADSVEALGLLLERRFDLLITDLNLSPITGDQLVLAVQLFPVEQRPKIIVCSADAGSSRPAFREAIARADRFLCKPVSARDLIAAVSAMLADCPRMV
jgi:CheY-like chemotaxis protein